MKRKCPNPHCAVPDFVYLDGKYRRLEDSKFIQRFRCKNCDKRFSTATFSDTYRQKRRRVNYPLLKLLASGISMRRSAIILKTDRRTVARKLPFLARRCRIQNDRILENLRGRIHNIQIDDLITKENSKLKPLTVTIAVDENRRVILATEVSKIPAFGHLSRTALKKYGSRKDEHHSGLKRVFERLQKVVSKTPQFKSDEHQRYPAFVSAYFPFGKHLTFKSERACVVGQGELKKVHFDPLFTVNHTCAILRANVNRLIRKTWCTTKDSERLKDHLDIFTFFYNGMLLGRALSPM